MQTKGAPIEPGWLRLCQASSIDAVGSEETNSLRESHDTVTAASSRTPLKLSKLARAMRSADNQPRVKRCRSSFATNPRRRSVSSEPTTSSISLHGSKPYSIAATQTQSCTMMLPQETVTYKLREGLLRPTYSAAQIMRCRCKRARRGS